MKKTRSTILTLALTVLIVGTIIFNRQIVQYLIVNVIYQKQMVIKDANDYEKKYDYEYIQQTNSFVPKNSQELLNVIYTSLNKGWDHFVFYCSSDYKDCLNDVEKLTKDNEKLSTINNFVHPFNEFDKMTISTNNFGKIELQIEKTYSEHMISKINEKVDEILAGEIRSDMSDLEKVKTIHDYIITHASYDREHAKIIEEKLPITPTYQSNTAYGTLLDGKAICGGYTDTMAIFLTRMGINNYKISSSNHIWNFVQLDDTWYHLDLTWDDPVVENGEETLLHTFFLISTEELEKNDISQHIYNKEVYKEAK